MNWVLIVAPAVASGVLGSIVTAYGTQARERLEARTKVRDSLLHVERLALRPDSARVQRHELVSALDEAEVAMVAASVPHRMIAFYRTARMWAYSTNVTMAGADNDNLGAPWAVTARVAEQAAALAVQVIRHPWLSALTRRWRIRRLQQLLVRHVPGLTEEEFRPQRGFREWKRELRRMYPGE